MNDVVPGAPTDTPGAEPAAVSPDYSVASQQRLLGLLQVLAGHEIDGLAPTQIARANECSASQVTRDLANLRQAGFAEQIQDTGRWRLGPALVQIALKHMTALDRAERQLGALRNRYSRGTGDDA